jgi:hypothetical protein
VGTTSSPDAGDRLSVDGKALRPGSATVVGVVCVVASLLLLVPALRRPGANLVLIASVVLALVLVWLFVVRPCARLGREGITLVNPLRTVELTWPVITEVRSKWALELVADGRRFTAWGVPADPKRPKYGRDLLLMGTNRVRGGTPAGQAAGAASPRRKVEAQTVAAEVEARMAADRRRKDGRTARIAEQSWDPVAVGVLAAAVAFLVVALVV